ncbi:MAG: hypothetical protein A2231_00395 [Candidatus Firestonebacteria bacterium RIFOXYA2_FULL_40_8]|nr:MAG: hypothetical protein A2231_00395 [Candidatus Firestonebacteria bacterium RIFOXYA2_FULL_40_8]
MIIHYGYEDNSGKFYVSINGFKCDNCGICLEKCPEKILGETVIMIELDDKKVAAVKEEFRKELKYTCAKCSREKEPCRTSCPKKAIAVSYEPKGT